MSRTLVLAAALLALAAPGCTLLVNGNQYVGNGNDGGPGSDGGPGNDAAVDAGPNHDGGGGNTAPVLLGVGLDNYRPMVGEAIHALPGRAYDAEGDTTSVHLQWYVNGAMRTGATSASLSTSGMSPGDVIHVEAWVNDGMLDSAHVQSADVTLLDAVTRWRQLLPNESGRLPLMVWDAPNRRAVRFVDGNAWEYTLEGTNLRVTLLPTTGTPPPSDDDNAIAFLDEERHRMIVWAGSDAGNIYALDISRRGGGAWTQTAAAGPTPSTTLLMTAFYDASTHSAYLVGGKDDTEGALSQFFQLDMTSAGAEVWSTPAQSGDALPPIFGAAIAADPTTAGRFYVIGGITSTVGTTTVDPVYSAVDHVYRLDTGTTSVSVMARANTEPPSFGAAATTLPGGQVLVYGGIDRFGPGAALSPPQTYDVAGDSFTPIPGTPHAAIFGLMAPDPATPSQAIALTIGGDLFSSSTDAPIFQIDTLTSAGVTMVTSRIGPGSIVEAAATLSGGGLRIVGGLARGDVATGAWTLDTSTMSWSRLMTHDDPATSHHPDPRYGVLNDASGFNGGPIFQVGGARATAVLADMGVFELQSDGTWLERSLISGTAPPARVGLVTTSGNCGGARLLAYGGEDASGNPLGDVIELDCTADHACTWTSSTPSAAARSYAAGFTSGTTLYLFGGRTVSGPTNEVIAVSDCFGGGPTTVSFTTSGVPPTARYGATITAMTDGTGAHTSGIMFGGTDGTLPFNDVDSLDLDATGATGTWTPLSPAGDAPRPRSAHVAVPDPTGRRILVAGGRAQDTFGTSDANDVWELVFRP
jgi:hypothetical protein